MAANVVDSSYHTRNLGTSASPSAQSVDVPASALAVVVHVAASSDGVNPVNVTGLSGDFCGTFTRVDEAGSLVAAYGCVGYAQVTSTGTGKTITVTFGGANTLAGATAIIYFLDNIDPANFVIGTPDTARTANGTTAATATVTTVADLVIAMDSRFDVSNSNVYPANETDYTSLTTAQSSNTYQLNSRLRRVTTPAAGTDTATTQTTYGSLVSLISFRGDQAVTPGLFTNSQTFHGPTVAPGAVSLTPALATNSQTFFTPTVSATYGLSPGLATNSQVFYGPVVVAGAITLTPDLAANTQTFYGPTVALGSGTQELLPSLATNTQTFYGATLTASYALAPALFTNAQTFFASSVDALYALAPETLVNTSIFYAATIFPGAVTLQPTLVTNNQAFYGPVVTQQADVELLPGLVTNEQIFYPPTVELAAQQALHYTVGWAGPQYERKSRRQRDEERRKLGILPEKPAVAEIPVSLAETKVLEGENRAVAERVARQLLERFAPKVTTPVAAVALPTPDEQSTIGPVELPIKVQATLAAAQKKRAFEQDLVYIVATLIS